MHVHRLLVGLDRYPASNNAVALTRPSGDSVRARSARNNWSATGWLWTV
jgi:hypothetical protein